MPSFECQVCGTSFEVPQKSLDRFAGWKPKYCREHSPKKKSGSKKKRSGGRGSGGRKGGGSEREVLRTLEEVREAFSGGPQDGVFTDGSCRPNPGPGGWGVVQVRGGEVVAQAHGHAEGTTNNRMELQALIEACKMLPIDSDETLYSDSNLCVQTINQWAAAWKRNGWKRKGGEVQNLDLVKELYGLVQERPGVSLKWIAAHDGSLWNEYADALATAWMRDTL